jgi:hypothetical protein
MKYNNVRNPDKCKEVGCYLLKFVSLTWVVVYSLLQAVAENSINLGHRIQLQNTSILAKKSRWMDWVIREAIEIELHPDNMNGGRWLLPESGMLICDLKEQG